MHKNFHSSAKMIVNDSDIGETFRSMHESAVRKIKNSVTEDWIIETILKY